MQHEGLTALQQEFTEVYSGLSRDKQIVFLAVLLYVSTMGARGSYEEAVEDAVKLWGFNELHHRVSDHLLALVTDSKQRRSDTDFCSLVIGYCRIYKVPLRMVLEKFKATVN